MNRLLLFTILLGGLCSVALQPQQPSPKVAKPNIIFILADDLGYGDLGCYRIPDAGKPLIKTPNLDRMAANGMRFTDFYTGSTVCAPSRCTLMSGRHTGHAYIRGNGEIPLRTEDTIMPQRLKTAGYRTAMFGKWGLGMKQNTGSPERKGWDDFYGITNHVAAHFQQPDTLWTIQNGTLIPVSNPKKNFANDLFVENALGFLETSARKPFFMYLALTIPHAELHLPPRYLSQYMTPDGQSRFAPETPWADGQHYGGQPNPRAAYAGMVTAIDDYVGQVMAKLKVLGIDKNTIVVFASDNGTHIEGGRTMGDVAYFQSSGPLQGVKRDMYDGGIRTPFLVQWTGTIRPGQVSKHIGAFWDVSNTVSELAGIAPDRQSDGLSFVPTLLNKKQPEHDYLYWEFYERGYDQAVRMGNWKGVKLSKTGSKLALFDLTSDIAEQTDVAAAHPDVVQKLEQALANAHVKSSIFPLKKK